MGLFYLLKSVKTHMQRPKDNLVMDFWSYHQQIERAVHLSPKFCFYITDLYLIDVH